MEKVKRVHAWEVHMYNYSTYMHGFITIRVAYFFWAILVLFKCSSTLLQPVGCNLGLTERSFWQICM